MDGSVSGYEGDPYVVEGPIKIESLTYHNRTMKFFMMEHHDVMAENSAVTELRPRNWAEKLKGEFSAGDSVFLEYFPRDLQRAAAIPIVGAPIKHWMEKSGIEVFNEIAEVVVAQGGNVKVADVASGSMYAYHELAIDDGKWRAEMQKRPLVERLGYAGGKSEPIDQLEINMPRAIDARRLMPARAMMQDSSKNVVWVGPEAH